ncbi:MAG: hypothetical protein K6C36_10190 [Clostridia bacterium]|nr:hypothetical protein [Clostridia bacterium]
MINIILVILHFLKIFAKLALVLVKLGFIPVNVEELIDSAIEALENDVGVEETPSEP